eukprot:12054070-Ditylum_brightwellii.AAC.1
MLTWKQLAKNGWLDLGHQIMPAHLLWAFSWLNGYSSYEVHAGQVRCGKKTFCKRVWFLVKGIANLDVTLIKWENRLIGDTGQHSLTTVDGADFKINKQTPFSSKWWSHEFNGPGL